jgi:glycerophosphoryl diester phosphodiesterase
MRTLIVLLVVTAVCAALGAQAPDRPRPSGSLPAGPWTIAHRGASAYAPENTVPAFLLGAQQGAHFIEIDIQRTKDGQLVILHDLTLERTTDVARVFPDRSRPDPADAEKKPRWWLDDFTLEELRRLDAGTWFDAKFAGTRVPTFDETIRAVKGRSGLFIELKSPERYPGIEAQMMKALAAQGLDVPGADPSTPVFIQSFTAASLETLAKSGVQLPLHMLFNARDADMWLSDAGFARLQTFATGISPEKPTLETHAAGWARARSLGLPITPWTFRASNVKGFASVTDEMAHYIREGRVAGVITDNPDLAPRRR